MSLLVPGERDRLLLRVEIDYVEAADQLLGFRERTVDSQMLAAAILDGDRFSIAAEPHRNEHQPGLSTADARAQQTIEFLLMVRDPTTDFFRIEAVRLPANLGARNHVFHRRLPLQQAATCRTS